MKKTRRIDRRIERRKPKQELTMPWTRYGPPPIACVMSTYDPDFIRRFTEAVEANSTFTSLPTTSQHTNGSPAGCGVYMERGEKWHYVGVPNDVLRSF